MGLPVCLTKVVCGNKESVSRCRQQGFNDVSRNTVHRRLMEESKLEDTGEQIERWWVRRERGGADNRGHESRPGYLMV